MKVHQKAAAISLRPAADKKNILKQVQDDSIWRMFNAVPAASATYSIQIRNASTDALITTYSFAANATKRFKNVTLMIRGLMGTTMGVNAFGVTEVNYF